MSYLKMKIAFVVIVFFFSNNIIAQELLFDKITKSIKKEDSLLLKQAFDYWYSSIPTWSSEILMENELLKNINEIIALFYSKKHMDVVMKTSYWWDKSLENDISKKFILFNGSLLFVRFSCNLNIADSIPCLIKLKSKINDSLGKSDLYNDIKWSYYHDSILVSRIDSISNIKPNINIEGQKILFISDTMNILLKKLFNNDKRRSFFYSQISVLNPFIENITFDNNFKYCLISYRWIDRGGCLFLKRKNNAWVICESEIIWIQ